MLSLPRFALFLGGFSLLTACGGKVLFDSATTGAEGGAPGSVTSTSSATSTSVGAPTTVGVTTVGATTSSGFGGAPNCLGDCKQQNPDGYHVVYEAAIEECGCHQNRPCTDLCSVDPACNDGKPNQGTIVSDPCSQCVIGEIDQGQQSVCATNAGLGPHCDQDPACQKFVQCYLDHCQAQGA